MNKKDKSGLFILDGYSLIYKSYFAFIRNPLYNKAGENTSAVFGFFRSLFSFMEQYKPEYFAVAMDSMVPTFRHEIYPEYKATRDKTPDDLHAQIPKIEKILEAVGVQIIRVNRYEADDIIAGYAKKCTDENRDFYIITGDKDLMQLVSDNVRVLRPEKNGYEELGPDEVFNHYGVRPEQITDYLALTGDSADNIPGVKGIGPKNAAALLGEHGSISELYNNIDNLKGSIKAKLEEGKESCFKSRELVILDDALDLPVPVENFTTEKYNLAESIPFFEKENAKSLVSWVSGKSGAVESGDVKAGELSDQAAAASSADINHDKTDNPYSGKGTYDTVTDLPQLDSWIEKVKQNKIYAFDIETDSLNTITASPVGFSISVKSGEGCYIPLKAGGREILPEPVVKSRLKSILEDKSLKLVGQNIKFDYKILRQWDIRCENIWFDTMIAAWLLNSRLSSFGMDNLADHYLDYKTIHYKDLVPSGSTFDQVPLETAAVYAAEDADITFRLYEVFVKQISERKIRDLFYKIEMPLVIITAEMELDGVRIRKEVLEAYGKELGESLEQLEKEIYSLCGRSFNISSPKQLQEVLFNERNLKTAKKTKTGFSTDNTVLEELAKEDPVPALVLRYRSLSKLKSTYVDALPLLVEPSTSKIHTTYRQTGTATGRLSSTNPNLQNIPIKDEEGRRIRRAFIPSAGRIFMSADYSQIELVVLAHLSEDPELIRAFTEGIDVHSLTASLLFDIKPEEVSYDQRRIAKTINFGVMYGMSSFRLSRELQIPRVRADEFIKSYFMRYSGIREYVDKTVKAAEESGYAKTILGRERYIDGINSKNRNEKGGAERMAVNTPIQGSAADIVKLAMINVTERIKKENLLSRLVLQVHDELIFEVPFKETEIMTKLIREEMEGVIVLKAPLRVNIETGESWGEMH